MISLGASSSFGSFPVDTDKNSSNLQESFTLRFVNYGDTDVEVSFSSDSSNNYELDLPENRVIEATDLAESPTGSGWMHIAGGKYAELYEETFRVEVKEERDSNSIKIPLTVSAREARISSGQTTANLVYQRQYTFDLKIEGRELSERESEELGWVEIKEERSLEQENKTASEAEEGRNFSSPGPDPRETPEKKVEKSNDLTIALIVGIALMIVYIWRMI